MESITGRIIQGKFEVLDRIGRGGMAVVYRARQLSLDRIVAIKMLSTDMMDLADLRERFEQEAKIIARLSHPNIVQVHDVCELEGEEGALCIIMEHIAGRTLQDVLREEQPLSIRRSLAIAEQIAAGLAYAHSQGVIHRDIKPQNVMLLCDDRVKIMDFGIARLRDSSLRTRTGVAMGTPEYMSPEQAVGKPVDCRSDLYSLSVVLYAMATGELPFSGDSPVTIGLQHVQQPPRPPTAINPQIPAAVEEIILKGMAKQPSERYSSADEFRAALLRAAAAESDEASFDDAPTVAAEWASATVPDTPRARPSAVAPGIVPFLRQNLKWIAAAGGGVAVVIIVLLLALPSRHRIEIAQPPVATITQREFQTLPVADLLQRLAALRASDAEGAQRAIAQGEAVLFKRMKEAVGLAQLDGRADQVLSMRTLATSAVLPALAGEARDRWMALLAQSTAAPPMAPTPSAARASGPLLPPREVELAMRRLNEPQSSDAGKARRAFETAQIAAGQLAALPESEWTSGVISQCLNGYVDSVAYHRENALYHAELARFVARDSGKWNLPPAVRDGLLRDARELLRQAKPLAADPAERARVGTVEREIGQALEGR